MLAEPMLLKSVVADPYTLADFDEANPLAGDEYHGAQTRFLTSGGLADIHREFFMLRSQSMG